VRSDKFDLNQGNKRTIFLFYFLVAACNDISICFLLVLDCSGGGTNILIIVIITMFHIGKCFLGKSCSLYRMINR